MKPPPSSTTANQSKKKNSKLTTKSKQGKVNSVKEKPPNEAIEKSPNETAPNDIIEKSPNEGNMLQPNQPPSPCSQLEFEDESNPSDSEAEDHDTAINHPFQTEVEPVDSLKCNEKELPNQRNKTELEKKQPNQSQENETESEEKQPNEEDLDRKSVV